MNHVELMERMSSKERTTHLVQMAKREFQRRQPWEDLWEDVYELTIPERWSRFTQTPRDVFDTVYDSSVIQSAARLANLLITGLIPPWVRWFELIPGPMVPKADRARLRKLLEPVNDVLFYSLNTSNLAQEAQPAFLDLTVGQGAVTIEPRGSEGIKFGCVPIEDLAFCEDSSGTIDYIYRRQRVSASEILANEGWLATLKVEDPEFAKKLQDNPTDKSTLLQILMPYEGKTKLYVVMADESAFSFSQMDAQVQRTLNGPVVILEERELDQNPMMIFRWSKVAGAAYGRGPAMEVFADNRSLNKVKELTLLNLAFSVNPVVTAMDDGIVNPNALVLRPGQIISVGSNDTNNPSVRELVRSANFDAAMFGIKDLRDAIQVAFLADRFSPVQGTKFTATEVVERARVAAQDLGATYTRLQNEFLIPMLQRSIHILGAQGKLPKGLKLDRFSVDVMFLSQLAQAQRLQEVDNIVQAMTIAGQIGQLDPRAAAVVNMEAGLREIATRLSVSEDILRTTEQIDEIVQGAAQAAAAMQLQVPGGASGSVEGTPPIQ